MDLTHLRYFQAIAQSRSITAASKVLHVTQPTLTVAMRNLEERLGTTLLLRDRSGVKLTKTGEELLRYAADIFALVENAEQQIKGLEDDDVGDFVIGCNESLGAYFLPAFLSKFLRDHRRINLALHNQSSVGVMQAVIDREVHFGLVVNPAPHPEVVILELFHDATDLFVAVDAPPPSRAVTLPRKTRKGGALPSGEDPELEAALTRLIAGPLVYAPRVAQCRELLDQLAADLLLPARTLTCGDLELVKSLALAGIGVAMLPRRVAAYGHEGKLRRLHRNLPFIPDTISLVYRADGHRTRAALAVKEALVKHGRELDKGRE